MASLRTCVGIATALTAGFAAALPRVATRELPVWTLLPTGSQAQFRGLAAVSDQEAWVSGSRSTVLRTTDGGASWTTVSPALPDPADSTLEFRDIEVLSSDRAVILSIGEGNASRIYITSDSGRSWTPTFVNTEPSAFYNCIAYTSPTRGFAISDPVDGRFRLVQTADGGDSWSPVATDDMPPAWEGEYGFSASGTCLTASPAGALFFATGGSVGNPGRVFRNPPGNGRAWAASNTTIAAASEGAGVFSVQFRDAARGVALGGDYTDPTASQGTAAFSVDGGETWQPAAAFPAGYRSGASWVPGRCGVAVAVGPTGSDITRDGGRTWELFDQGSFDAVQCLPGGVCWASGQGGRVARLIIP